MQARQRKVRTFTVGSAAALAMLLGLGSALWGQPAELRDSLPAELAVQLERGRWDDGTLTELAQEQVDWSQFRARDARLVAEALQYAGSVDGEVGAQELAQVAVQICSLIREMESLGYGESTTARAVFAGVRASLQEMAEWRSGEGDRDLGRRIQNRFRNELRLQTAEQTRTLERERARAENSAGAGGPVIGPGPGGPPGKS
jgi:DNA-binding transcriptional regulator YdaS (Cro superfamily)